jgi:hypothetical protein
MRHQRRLKTQTSLDGLLRAQIPKDHLMSRLAFPSRANAKRLDGKGGSVQRQDGDFQIRGRVAFVPARGNELAHRNLRIRMQEIRDSAPQQLIGGLGRSIPHQRLVDVDIAPVDVDADTNRTVIE